MVSGDFLVTGESENEVPLDICTGLNINCRYNQRRHLQRRWVRGWIAPEAVIVADDNKLNTGKQLETHRENERNLTMASAC